MASPDPMGFGKASKKLEEHEGIKDKNTVLDDTQPSSAKCANCGALASLRCTGCVDAPEYESGESIGIIYCNRGCQHKEAALANSQCTLAMALLGPLTRHLLAGTSLSTTISDISVGKPNFTTKFVSGLGKPSNFVPPHTIVVVELKSSQKSNEKWIIDASGSQYGFPDALSPFDKYFKEKLCKLETSEPYDATETKDIDYFLTIPYMTSIPQHRKKLMNERAARLHFAAFIKARIEKSEGGFNKDMFSSSKIDFQAKLDIFVGDLKVHMTEFVKKQYGKAGSAKKA
ncbi:uncharacterized protein BP5553_06782 [Venustampulla echinocandica]|uniref:MYND-type zinc finger protein samB n=1 Tax=Venustampulla echinocandica TaxID=2656787 RepID=A0A370TKW3_9HELO|nr:uncharacterized protein BP5553_06782 [Venustampulla echinocandica]RDL36170.1 hypothetical protein BP5553_06782 [Venustampulla echinocandica]